MLAELRRMAEDTAQSTFHDLVVAYLLTGEWDPELEARYRAAERIVEVADQTYEALQLDDPEAPDYTAMRDPGDHFAYPA